MFFGNNSELSQRCEEAIEEKRKLFSNRDSFIDPYDTDLYLNCWKDIYQDAKRKNNSVLSWLRKSKVISEFLIEYANLSQEATEHNDRLADRLIGNAAELILPLEGKTLDEQQLKCIVKDVRNNLIIAGAGTGKTTTILGYIKYLINSHKCEGQDILVLSFTRASAAELSERCNKEINEPIDVYTFHKLGLNIINSINDKKVKIYSNNLKGFIRSELMQLIKDEKYFRKLVTYLLYFYKEGPSELTFSSETEYRNYLQFNPPVTLKKEKVKSYGELEIANFLYENNIKYEYEKEYPVDTRTKDFSQYYPDFYLTDYDIYIEYFGIDRNGNVPSYFSSPNGDSPSKRYQEGIQWKRNLHLEYGTKLIEAYAFEKIEGSLLDNLKKNLENEGVVFCQRSSEEIWNQISGTQNQKIDQISELFETIINLIKSNNYSIEEVCEKAKGFSFKNSVLKLMDLIAPLFESYEKELENTNSIDFNDMINLATEIVKTGKFVHTYKYMIIDEYQDISKARYSLIKALREQKDFHLFCVGDDWQSIYRFSGSDIGFILNFKYYWGGTEVSRIETTYRFSDKQIEASSEFIMKNPFQIKKTLRSNVSVKETPIYKKYYKTEEFSKSLAEELEKLPIGSTVFLLGRYHFDIEQIKDDLIFEIKYGIDKKSVIINYKKRKDLRLSFLTIHQSKGLQADYVFLLNNRSGNMGFPSHVMESTILNLLLENKEQYPYAEERRLFYVALTRAKYKVFLMVKSGNISDFVNELDLKEPNTNYRSNIGTTGLVCPVCGGKLLKIHGRYGDFLGCENYRKTGCTYKRNIRVKG